MLKSLVNKIFQLSSRAEKRENALNHSNEQLIIAANTLHRLNLTSSLEILKDIKKAEFKVFSQWGDDGIIHFLVDYLCLDVPIFVEFGVENYTESNTRFLLLNKNWEGHIFDGDPENMQQVVHSDLYWRYNLTASSEWISKENINQLLKERSLSGEIGILSIDIDGNDYWVWKEISQVNPQMVIVEYNSLFGCENTWTVPYKANFKRIEEHYSNLYYGASLPALCQLANDKGYSFVGCNSNGNNAYFVRNDRLKQLEVKQPIEGFVMAQFRESRNSKGDLSFLNYEKRRQHIFGMPVFNTTMNRIEVVGS